MLFVLSVMELGASYSRLRRRYLRNGFLNSLENPCFVLRREGDSKRLFSRRLALTSSASIFLTSSCARISTLRNARTCCSDVYAAIWRTCPRLLPPLSI